MASIEYSRQRRAWRVRWREFPGQPVQSTAWLRDKAEAVERLDQKNAVEAAHKNRSGEVPTLAAAMPRWLAASRIDARYHAKSTGTLRGCFTRWGVERFAQLTHAGMSDIRAGERRLLLAFLRWANKADIPFDARLLHPPAARRIRPAKAPAPLLTDAQVGSLIATAALWSPSGEAIAHIIATYGHRPESLVGMRGEDVDIPGRRMRLRIKGREAPAWTPITAQTASMLARLTPEAGAPVFVAHDGLPWKRGADFANWWWRCVGEPTVGAALAGVYHLKRYALTRLAEMLKHDLATAASITMHADPNVLARYLRTNDERQARAITAIEAATPAISVPQPSPNPAAPKRKTIHKRPSVK